MSELFKLWHIVTTMGVLIIYLLIRLWILIGDVKEIRERTLFFLKSDLRREILEAKIELAKRFKLKNK